eukprot:TRINITY_DN12863_c0_g1_i1.p1 TRINITY_DN12863_c0_g1~~TRINITY_DN12863_c0_g1_i1.p1  ORF type:complete len:450 (-),score=56.98 TRINITY_DN12863_c0_g1_i1:142-1491(-)
MLLDVPRETSAGNKCWRVVENDCFFQVQQYTMGAAGKMVRLAKTPLSHEKVTNFRVLTVSPPYLEVAVAKTQNEALQDLAKLRVTMRSLALGYPLRETLHAVNLEKHLSAIALRTYVRTEDWSMMYCSLLLCADAQRVAFSFLEPDELARAARVCMAWASVARGNDLWRPHLVAINAELGIIDWELWPTAVDPVVVNEDVLSCYDLYVLTLREAMHRDTIDDEEWDVEYRHRNHEASISTGLFGLAEHLCKGSTRTLKRGAAKIACCTGAGAYVGAMSGPRHQPPVALALGIAGGVAGFAVGTLAAVPNVVDGVVGQPIAGVACVLEGTSQGVRSVPDALFGDWDRQKGSASGVQQKMGQKLADHDGGVTWGLLLGLGSLGTGIATGVAGLVTDPVRGAKERGATGALKGLGKGLVGLVCRPTSGALDLTSGVLRGASNRSRQAANLFR